MAKDVTAAGIDVGSKTFHLAVLGSDLVQEFENSNPGRKALISALLKCKGDIVVVLESTGPYGLDLALRLHKKKRIAVHYVNPLAAKGYASRGLVRAKTDRVDALTLARMAADTKATPWVPPEQHALELRALTRRIRTLINDRTREKNRLGSSEAAVLFPMVLDDIKENIRSLTERIDRLRAVAVTFAKKTSEVSESIDLLISIKGVADNTAVEVLGELRCLPRDLTCKQLVAMAGLDPRPKQSGTVDGPRHISKMGSPYLRAALHMAALNGVRWVPEITAFYKVLTVDRKKKSTVALVAVARKLLHTMHGMLRNRERFDPSRFYTPDRQKSAGNA